MKNKKKGYGQKTIADCFEASQSLAEAHDAQKSSDVSNGGTRSINDDKTIRQDKKRRINENGDTVVIDLTLEEDEVEKKEDTQ